MTVPGKGGRPSLEDKLTEKDYEKVEIMGKFRASHETMASEFDVEVQTIEDLMSRDRKPQSKFSRVYKRGLAQMRMKLSEAQVHTAINDKNPTLLVWLGKQHLDQSDKPGEQLNINVDANNLSEEDINKKLDTLRNKTSKDA